MERWISIVPLAIVLSLTACSSEPLAIHAPQPVTLYLVRHAEKITDGTRDPALTQQGEERAETLATLLKNAAITSAWTSDYRRTRQTLEPFLSATGLTSRVYDPSDLNTLARYLLTENRNTLVVGHSNTTPQLARLLCACEVADMAETQYDLLFEVHLEAGGNRLEIMQQSAIGDH